MDPFKYMLREMIGLRKAPPFVLRHASKRDCRQSALNQAILSRKIRKIRDDDDHSIGTQQGSGDAVRGGGFSFGVCTGWSPITRRRISACQHTKANISQRFFRMFPSFEQSRQFGLCRLSMPITHRTFGIVVAIVLIADAIQPELFPSNDVHIRSDDLDDFERKCFLSMFLPRPLEKSAMMPVLSQFEIRGPTNVAPAGLCMSDGIDDSWPWHLPMILIFNQEINRLDRAIFCPHLSVGRLWLMCGKSDATDERAPI